MTHNFNSSTAKLDILDFSKEPLSKFPFDEDEKLETIINQKEETIPSSMEEDFKHQINHHKEYGGDIMNIENIEQIAYLTALQADLINMIKKYKNA